MSETINCNILHEMKVIDYLKENTIYLDCEIDRDSQVLFCRQLRKLARQELAKKKSERLPIKIYISSFGGSVWSVFHMISDMEYWQENGIVIETYCHGYTCSGGSKILMAGSKGHRYITRYARVLIHQPNSFRCGRSTLQEDIDDLRYTLEDWELLKEIFKKHTNLTDKELLELTEKNRDVIYFSKEVIEKGLADKII